MNLLYQRIGHRTNGIQMHWFNREHTLQRNKTRCRFQTYVGSLGIVLATFTNSTAQFGMLAPPVLLTLTLLSGSVTPLESMPVWLHNVMQFAPATHFVNFAQAVLYRGADLEIVWPNLAAVAALTIVFFGISLIRFRAAMMAFQ